MSAMKQVMKRMDIDHKVGQPFLKAFKAAGYEDDGYTRSESFYYVCESYLERGDSYPQILEYFLKQNGLQA